MIEGKADTHPSYPEQGCSLGISLCKCHIFLSGKGLWLMIHSLCQTILVKRFISLQRWWIASVFWAFWWSWVPSVALMLHVPAVSFLAFCELQPVLPSGLISTDQLRPEKKLSIFTEGTSKFTKPLVAPVCGSKVRTEAQAGRAVLVRQLSTRAQCLSFVMVIHPFFACLVVFLSLLVCLD